MREAYVTGSAGTWETPLDILRKAFAHECHPRDQRGYSYRLGHTRIEPWQQHEEVSVPTEDELASFEIPKTICAQRGFSTSTFPQLLFLPHSSWNYSPYLVKTTYFNVPRPLDSPFAALGWIYAGLFAFFHIETYLLRAQGFQGTSLQKDYNNFHTWVCKLLHIEAPKDIRDRPYSTLLEIFLTGCYDRLTDTSKRDPGLAQVLFPMLIHIRPIHAYFAVHYMWELAYLGTIRTQAYWIALSLLSGAFVNYATWKSARNALLTLPVSDRTGPAITSLKRDLSERRSDAWRSIKSSIRRLRPAALFASTKRFISYSFRLSRLSEISVGIGSSGGTSFLRTFFVVLSRSNKALQRLSISDSIFQPIAMNLAEAETVDSLQMLIAGYALNKAGEIFADQHPGLRWLLYPKLTQAAVVVAAAQVVQYVLALSPTVSHLAHLYGSGMGAAAALLLAPLMGRMRNGMVADVLV